MQKKVNKTMILCLSLTLMIVSLATIDTHIQRVFSASTVDAVSLASEFLQVAGFSGSGYQVVISPESQPRNISTSVNPHFETQVSATVSNKYGKSANDFAFIDGKFWSYNAYLNGIDNGSGERSFDDLLKELTGIVGGFGSLLNGSYWNNFGQLISTALQTRLMTAENQNFILEIQNESILNAACYEKIDGNQTSFFRSMQVGLTRTGFVRYVVDDMLLYHVITTNVTVSDEQAIAIAEPYFKSFAQENQQNITAINATFSYVNNQWTPRSDGDGQFALYPMWTVIAEYDKVAVKYDAKSYGVLIWADNGAIVTYGPEAYYASTPPNNDNFLTAGLVLLLIASVFALAVGMGTYLHRKRRK